MAITDLIPQLRLVGLGLVAAGGFAAAEIYEHTVPWGLGPKLTRLRDSLPARDAERYSAGSKDQRARDEEVVQNGWKPRLEQCEARTTQVSVDAGRSIDAEKTARESATEAAYRLGRASCGGKTSEAKPATSSSVPGRVQPDEDLRSIVAGSLGTTAR